MRAPWPEPDPAALEQDEIELVVQVNGKSSAASVRVPKTADQRGHRSDGASRGDFVKKYVGEQGDPARHHRARPADQRRRLR